MVLDIRFNFGESATEAIITLSAFPSRVGIMRRIFLILLVSTPAAGSVISMRLSLFVRIRSAASIIPSFHSNYYKL